MMRKMSVVAAIKFIFGIVCCFVAAGYFVIIILDIVSLVSAGPHPEQPVVVSVESEVQQDAKRIIAVTVKLKEIHTGFEVCISGDPEFGCDVQTLSADSTESIVTLRSDPWDTGVDTVYYKVRSYVEMADGEMLYSDWTSCEQYSL